MSLCPNWLKAESENIGYLKVYTTAEFRSETPIKGDGNILGGKTMDSGKLIPYFAGEWYAFDSSGIISDDGPFEYFDDSQQGTEYLQALGPHLGEYITFGYPDFDAKLPLDGKRPLLFFLESDYGISISRFFEYRDPSEPRSAATVKIPDIALEDDNGTELDDDDEPVKDHHRVTVK